MLQSSRHWHDEAEGTYVLEPCLTERARTTILVTKGSVEIILNRPSYILVGNLLNLLISFSNHTKLTELTEYPISVVTMIKDSAEQDEPFTVIPLYKKKVEKKTIIQ